MKKRLKMDHRAESRFVSVGACELLRILRCTVNGCIVPLGDNLIEIIVFCIYLRYINITDGQVYHYRALPANCRLIMFFNTASIKNNLDKLVIFGDFIRVLEMLHR